MKALLVILAILSCVIIGCAKPEIKTQAGISVSEYNDLKLRYDTLQFNYDSLKRASEGTKDANEKYNAQVNELQVLRVENAVLKGQVQTLTAQYNAAVNALTGKQADALKALEQMNKQLEEEQARNIVINAQVQLLIKRQVSLLSANLTDAEYKACYKGVDLWWGTFND
jgi:hypothetical protein